MVSASPDMRYSRLDTGLNKTVTMNPTTNNNHNTDHSAINYDFSSRSGETDGDDVDRSLGSFKERTLTSSCIESGATADPMAVDTIQQQHQHQHQQQHQTRPQQSTNNEADADSSRPWSELKTKAGKERKRLPLACIVCRRKKIRCSGEKPACKHCYRSRIPCVYKVTTRKAAPRTDYMAMLDKRLKRMEERVIKIIPKDDPRDMVGIGRAAVKPPIAGQISRPVRTIHKKRSADEAFSAELKEWTQSADSCRGDNNEIPESLLNFSDPVPPSLKPRTGNEGKLLVEGAEHLPSLEIQEHLAEVFFDCIYGQSFLLLHKPSFMRKLKTGAVPPVLILAICAVSARFSTHPQVNHEPAFLRGENWANPAASIALSRHDEPNMTILTVFLILGLHEFGVCHGGRSWSFGGQALRMAYALQLHQELDHDPIGHGNNPSELSCTDREIRRRTMWACVLVDRYNSSGSQRPPISNEKFLHIQLPIKESLFRREIPGPTEDLNGSVLHPIPDGLGQLSNPKDNMGVSAYMIQGIMLWGRIVDYLNLGGKKIDPHPLWSPESGYTQLKKQLSEFVSSLPDNLTFSWENLQNHIVEKIANQFLFLHIIIHQNTLFLNRFAIPLSPAGRPPRDMPKPFLSDAGRAAVEAASHISMLIDQASGHLLTAPFAGYCAYAASTVHIWGIFSKNSQLEAASKENLRHTYKYLNTMKRYWGMFHYMVESAKERYRHFANAAARGRSTGESNGNGEDCQMFQYGDWFDKYPHGVSKLHWQDPNTEVKRETGADAVMGHQSDLQSVEDFFASLSPPSQADLPRKEMKKTGTNTPEKSRRQNLPRKNSKSQRDPPLPLKSQTTVPARQQQQQQQPAATIDTRVNPPQPSLPTHPDTDYPNFNNATLFHPTEHFLTPELKLSCNPDPLPQLDRQLVYGAYAGGETITPPSVPIASSHDHHNGAEPHSSHLWTHHSPFEMLGGQNWNGEFIQPGAWFLPFNLDPVSGGLDIAAAPGAPQSVSNPTSATASRLSMDGSSYFSPGGIMDSANLGLGMVDHPPAPVMRCPAESMSESVG
ncbi:hypothetical protein FQN57_002450 [Myotisia sp. PD_48]|nr:hypothetical protein FQN57_002450 [Myotisia sp. PD_48]